jgi:hypothetical protein
MSQRYPTPDIQLFLARIEDSLRPISSLPLNLKSTKPLSTPCFSSRPRSMSRGRLFRKSRRTTQGRITGTRRSSRMFTEDQVSGCVNEPVVPPFETSCTTRLCGSTNLLRGEVPPSDRYMGSPFTRGDLHSSAKGAEASDGRLPPYV